MRVHLVSEKFNINYLKTYENGKILGRHDLEIDEELGRKS